VCGLWITNAVWGEFLVSLEINLSTHAHAKNKLIQRRSFNGNPANIIAATSADIYF
jgi:hypothetical protein